MAAWLTIESLLLFEGTIRHMTKTSHIRRFSIMMAGVCALNFASVCSAADETHVIFPPLQLFKDFCLDAGWSLARAGGGYVWDEVLEYRVWCLPRMERRTKRMVMITTCLL
jgi:hypothetical protein